MPTIKTLIKKTPTKSGVYIMRDAEKKILYVGKAKNLKKRLLSYSRSNLTPKTTALVRKISTIETIITSTEHEALILENQLIKQHHPPYNIVFRDDKTYPYLLLSHDEFPRITYYRGDQTEPGDYFGPYTRTGGIRKSLQLIQKLFRLRICTNQTFKSRKRPCLQYQMKRCSAPCVGKISKTDYANDAMLAKLFLQGRNSEVIKTLSKQMEKASQKMAYETAAKYRDQIHWLRELQKQQITLLNEKNNTDIIAILREKNLICVYLMNLYQGRFVGSKTFYTHAKENISLEAVAESFIIQHYDSPKTHPLPRKIILNISLSQIKVIQETLIKQTRHKITIKIYKKVSLHQGLQMALLNAAQQLKQKPESAPNNFKKKFIALQKLLNLRKPPGFIQCFDISHTMGEATVASCVGFNSNGPDKSGYRHINIKNVAAGDDPGAMKEALSRYYQKGRLLPDIIVIDGGRTQLNSAQKILNQLNIDTVLLIGIAKGPDRKPGLEKIYVSGVHSPLDLSGHTNAFRLLQHIRDEAHRFAISFHRKKLSIQKKQSSLEKIPGIGKKRRQMLLKHFGGLQGLSNANIDDIAKIKGISKTMAADIYKYLNSPSGKSNQEKY